MLVVCDGALPSNWSEKLKSNSSIIVYMFSSTTLIILVIMENITYSTMPLLPIDPNYQKPSHI